MSTPDHDWPGASDSTLAGRVTGSSPVRLITAPSRRQNAATAPGVSGSAARSIASNCGVLSNTSATPPTALPPTRTGAA